VMSREFLSLVIFLGTRETYKYDEFVVLCSSILL
jgi:hypothetical protein